MSYPQETATSVVPQNSQEGQMSSNAGFVESPLNPPSLAKDSLSALNTLTLATSGFQRIMDTSDVVNTVPQPPNKRPADSLSWSPVEDTSSPPFQDLNASQLNTAPEFLKPTRPAQ
ncbi:hypothetical protein Zmor_021568 [Zophobas morio]|uniref:Uncharacterized protein n=1 Tax=Zophobas morio TaxID=2755281 RepID=A0AA38MAL1_9CUCU|nr:hypothetical protein Zmor_021568 [Zophobas morio]